jgi:hypothetical protein
VAELNWKGKVCSQPLGGAGNIAFKNQMGKKQLKNNGLYRITAPAVRATSS